MKRLYTPLGVLLLTVLMAGGARAQSVNAKGASQLDNARAALARETATFIENKGQWDSRARYLARMPGLDLWVTDGGLTYDLFRMEGANGGFDKGGKRVGHVVRMSFEGAGDEAAAKGVGRLSGTYNYLTGKDRRGWASSVGRYSEARIEHLYNGIDAALYFDGGLPRYDLVLAPGADPSDIHIAYEGASSLSVNGTGDLVIGTSIGDVKQQGLFAYQIVNGAKKQIACRFVVEKDDRIGFALGAYDRTKPLVIDPLIYSTYFGGGGGWDEPRAIATDLAGMVYIAGFTLAPNFPALVGSYQTTFGGTIGGVPPGGDAFVAKLDITQSPANQLVYATFIGGTDDELATDITVDLQGSAYITGVAPNTFPTTNAVVPTSGRGIFAAKLTPSGGNLVYSTFVADDAFTDEGGIMIDNLGQATVVGSTTSTTFPAFAIAYQPAKSGGADAFVARLNATGNSLVYATYLGGSDDDVATDVAGDVAAIHVTGYTSSTNFPLTKTTAYDTTYNGDRDGFVSRLEPGVLTGTAQLTYSTYFGGSDDDVANALAIDSFGYINVTGYTSSNDFPTKNASQNIFSGGSNLNSDAFMLKLNPFAAAASQLLFSTYLGGVNDDVATDIALDTDRDAYITGWTESVGFPTSNNALRPLFGGDSVDGFVAKFVSTTGELTYSTFLGGSGGDRAYGIAISNNEQINVTGSTWSTNYMVTPNAFQGAHSGVLGGPDGFITRFAILQVTSPNGGELVCAGSIRNITWTGGTSTNYDLYISSNGGVTYNVLSLNVVGNSFAWPIPNGFPADTDYRVKVVVSGGAENDVSDRNFTINTPPVITLQPNNVTQPLGGTAVFTAGATGIPTPTVQWEVNNGTAWTPIPGATSTTLTLNGVTSAQSGNQYRAVFTNSCASTTTNPVTLTVSSVRLVTPNGGEEWCAGTVHPITWDSGSANGPYDLAVSKDGGLSWQTIAVGVNGSTYNWSIPGTFAGNQFLVQVRLSNGQTGDISDRPFTINSAPRISRQPGNVTVNAGSSASFPAEGSGSPFPTIQWEINSGSGWTAVTGATGTTFVISSPTVAQSGTRVRAIFSNTCGSDTSREATLTVLPTSGVDDPTTGLGALRLTVAPNPVASNGELRLSLPHGGLVQIDMADINGNVVTRLADRMMSAGDHQIAFSTGGIPNGTYLIILNTGGERRTVKMTVTK